MTERACNTDTRQLVASVHSTTKPHNGVQPQQLDCHRRVRQIHFSRAQCAYERAWQGFDVNFEADTQRGRRVDGRKDLVHSEKTRPELFVTEGVEAKDYPPVLMRLQIVTRAARLLLGLTGKICAPDHACEGENQHGRHRADESHRRSFSIGAMAARKVTAPPWASFLSRQQFS